MVVYGDYNNNDIWLGETQLWLRPWNYVHGLYGNSTTVAGISCEIRLRMMGSMELLGGSSHLISGL